MTATIRCLLSSDAGADPELALLVHGGETLAWEAEADSDDEFFQTASRLSNRLGELPCSVRVTTGRADPSGKEDLGKRTSHGYITVRPSAREISGEELRATKKIVLDSGAPLQLEKVHVNLYVSEQLMTRLLGFASKGNVPMCEVFVDPEDSTSWDTETNHALFVEAVNFEINVKVE